MSSETRGAGFERTRIAPIEPSLIEQPGAAAAANLNSLALGCRNGLLLAGTLYCGGSGGVGVEGVAGATVQEAGQAVVVTEGGGPDL